MAPLSDILTQTLETYTGKGFNCIMLPLFDDKHHTYAVAAKDYPTRKEPTDLVLMARIVDDKIVIEEDATDRPLVEALIRAGIPREQIILVYAGETVPDALTT